MQLFFECLIKSHDIKEYELILIGDGCRNQKVIDYAEQLRNTKIVDSLILLDNPIGFGQANNRGVEKASTEQLVFINDDILLMDHEIDALLQEQNRLNCAAIQPVLLYPQTDLIQSTGHIFGDNFNRHAHQGIKKDKLVLPDSVERQALTLSFCAIKRNVFFQTGGFDPFFYNAFEGLELTHRIHAEKLGCKVQISPKTSNFLIFYKKLSFFLHQAYYYFKQLSPCHLKQFITPLRLHRHPKSPTYTPHP